MAECILQNNGSVYEPNENTVFLGLHAWGSDTNTHTLTYTCTETGIMCAFWTRSGNPSYDTKILLNNVALTKQTATKSDALNHYESFGYAGDGGIGTFWRGTVKKGDVIKMQIQNTEAWATVACNAVIIYE